jgi:predicted lipid-binding transport protein (Tim44 family)
MAIANSVGSGSGSSQPSSETGSAKQAAQHSAGQSSSVPHQVLSALGSTTSVGPAKVPTMGLLMFALIFTLGTALTASFIYLSQRARLDPKAALKAPAPLPTDPVEAELQEMIGDALAKKLLADLELGEAVSPLAE